MDGTEIQTRQLAHRSRRHDVHGDPGDRVRTEKAPVRALFLRIQQMLQDLFAVIEKYIHYLITVGVFVGARVDPALVEGKNLRARKPEKDRGMGSDDELRTVLRAAVYLRKQRQLPLRGQGCLGLIEKIEAAGSKRVLRERKKALPVGFFVVMLGDAPGSAAVLIFHGGDIIEALRAKEIPVDGLSDTAREADGAAQLRVRVVC